MKRYAKLLQLDARGQLVIPKDLRDALKLTEGTGLWAFLVTDEGILLKKAAQPDLASTPEAKALKEEGHKAGVAKRNVERSEEHYATKTKEAFDDL